MMACRSRLLGAAALVTLLVSPALARSPLTDDQIRGQLIQESGSAYHATGHPCACPYDSARNGSACGTRSAYSRPGGAEPLCYPKDVTDGMVTDWRARHP